MSRTSRSSRGEAAASPSARRQAVLLAATLVAAAVDIPVGAAASQTYVVTDLGTLGGDTSASAINNAGWVVGTSVKFPPVSRRVDLAFLYRDGAMAGLGTVAGRFGEVFFWSSGATAINDAGDVVGSSDAPAGPYAPSSPEHHAFLYRGRRMIDLGTLGTDSVATGLNDAGDVVGYYRVAGDVTHAFLHRGGTMHDIGTLGGASSRATAVNADGVVVGFANFDAGFASHVFRYAGGVMTDLGTLGGDFGEPRAINRYGQIVGHARLSESFDEHAFLYDDGVMHDLGSLAGPPYASGADDINAAGQVVGSSSAATGEPGGFVTHGFLYSDGVMVDLNTLVPAGSPVFYGATAINDAGQIVATGLVKTIFSTPSYRAYLLTPMCGNGQVDAGETCDDGVQNGTASCCTTGCMLAPEGTRCDGGRCGQAGTCQRMLACGSAPATGCRPAASGKSKLDVRSDEITWTWTGSARVAVADFGDPTIDADYQLCLYDGASLAAQARIPADGRCGRRRCWARLGRAGYERRSTSSDPDGIVEVGLRVGRRGVGKLRVAGAGAHLTPPALPLALPVRVQLQHDAGTACWEASFTRAVTNASDRFTANAD